MRSYQREVGRRGEKKGRWKAGKVTGWNESGGKESADLRALLGNGAHGICKLLGNEAHGVCKMYLYLRCGNYTEGIQPNSNSQDSDSCMYTGIDPKALCMPQDFLQLKYMFSPWTTIKYRH